ncbi:hypothetical protein BRD17_02210, partial [Halobacteriales archaeon SW_7_68_16]
SRAGSGTLAHGSDVAAIHAWGYDYSWGMGRYDDARMHLDDLQVQYLPADAVRAELMPVRDSRVYEDRTFTTTHSIGSDLSYEWSFGDGGSAQGRTVSHAYDETGTYTVELTVTDAQGRTDTDTEPIQVSRIDDEFESDTPWITEGYDGSISRSTSYAAQSTHSLRVSGNDYDDDLAHRDAYLAEQQPDTLSFSLRRQSGDGGGIRVRNADGNYEAGFAIEQDDWIVSGGNGDETVYRTADSGWVQVTMDFDWQAGEYTYQVEHLSTGTTRSGTQPLRHGDGVTDVQAWGYDYSWGMSKYDDVTMYLDDLELHNQGTRRWERSVVSAGGERRCRLPSDRLAPCAPVSVPDDDLDPIRGLDGDGFATCPVARAEDRVDADHVVAPPRTLTARMPLPPVARRRSVTDRIAAEPAPPSVPPGRPDRRRPS